MATSGVNRIADFEDLGAGKFAAKLRTEIYALVSTLPKEECHGLAAQIRRAAVSVTANIAERYGHCSYKENVQFCRQSRGSLYELRDHLTPALDAGYILREKQRRGMCNQTEGFPIFRFLFSLF